MSDLDLSRLIPEELAALSAYHPPEGKHPVKLDANENPFPTPPLILEEAGKAAVSVELNRYPDPASRELRKSFAGRFLCRVENVMAGNGSDELIGFLTWTLRGHRPGKKPVLVVPAPTFAMYSIAARAAGYEVCEVPLDQGLQPDMEAMLQAVREKDPNIVFISNPNNPTGSWFSREQVREIMRSTGGLVVVDEAYADFSKEASWIPEVASAGNLAVLRTLSKVGGAALRCGFLVAGNDLLKEVNKVRFPFNLSRYSQVTGEVVLRHYDLLLPCVEAVIGERERLSSELENLGLKVFPSRGNFLLVRCQGREEGLWRFLQEGGIVVKFLSRLPVAGDSLRVTVGTPEDNDRFLDGVKDFLAEGGADA